MAISAEAQQATLKVADSLYVTGNYFKAINQYAKVGSNTSELQIARAYTAIGNYHKAIGQYHHIISKDSTSQIARFELAKVYLKTKKPKVASDMLIELTELDSTNAEYFYYLGKTLQTLKKDFMGNKAFVISATLDSTHLRSLFEIAKYYVAQREKDSVLKYAEKGLRFYADDVALINLKALAYFNNDEHAKARPFFEKLVDLGEHKEFIYSKLAFCYFKTWEFEKSKITYKKVLALNDGNADAYYHLGEVFLKDRQADSAQFYFKEAIAVQKPVLVREYEGLARVARVLNNTKAALEFYQLAYEEDKENALLYFNVCTQADSYYKDPITKLKYYEKFVEKFGNHNPYTVKMANKRISELKEEIHFSGN
ncbi:tetratricopeptide repeat protein [Pareuzebyella sediminis]|uniref:tetratricopeptide repeat protein n=1 Tax=Pareuzebyella sediminis TaxID=2607998 RepID=UPI001E3B5ADC|nr:tetratricopeptide repeat protein [Pareuzebyella sediminis]